MTLHTMAADAEICAAVRYGSSTLSLDEPIDFTLYPDRMPLVRVSERDEAVHRLLVRPSSVLSLMTALWYVDARRERGLVVPELVLPLVPGSRQDRLNPEGDYLFTLKSVATEINLRQFPRVVILDPHSDVTPALIERCEVVHADQILHWGLGRAPAPPASMSDYDAVVSPDAGAEKRAGRVARLLGKPLLHAWKTRDVKDGKITGFGLEIPLPKTGIFRVLVVDDLCDAGGTFIGLGQLLKERGFEADLYVTHGFFTKGTADLSTYYSKILTTDSVIAASPQRGVHEIPVSASLLLGGVL